MASDSFGVKVLNIRNLAVQAKAQQAAWKAALARAAGEKVLDDPKLLRKSLKRETKRREKHGKAWQVRTLRVSKITIALAVKLDPNTGPGVKESMSVYQHSSTLCAFAAG